MKIPSAAVAAAITLAALTAAAVTTSIAGAGPAGLTTPTEALDASIGRGRYLVSITGCNDCHTPGYTQAGGQAPISQWLTGQSVGFQGPWGTSYPANLRLTVQSLTEEQWLVFARAERRPPMPWFALKDMSDGDLKDVYRFIRSLGEAGQPAPTAVAPGGKVATPFIMMMPQSAGTSASSHVGAPTAQLTTPAAPIAQPTAVPPTARLTTPVAPLPEVVVRANRVVASTDVSAVSLAQNSVRVTSRDVTVIRR
jgi:mono/diheme cytochrome c family protein